MHGICSGAGGRPTRRSFVATGVMTVGTGLLGGCLGGAGETVSVLSAGSLAQTFEAYVGPSFEEATGIAVHGEYYGANAVMRMVEDRTHHPDVIVSADATLLRDRLYGAFTDWDVEFATNSLGIGYNDATAVGERLAAGEPWYEVLSDTEFGEVTVGDPNLDPLGYRAVQAFELAEREYGIEGLRDDLLDRVEREPDEPAMMAGVESGSRAASVVYRNMAVDHDIPFLEFPDRYSFASTELADHYATVEYTTDEEGYTAEGRPVLYNATVNDDADNPSAGLDLVQFLVDNGPLLEDAGLTVGDGVPRGEGAVPEAVTV